MKCYTDLNEKKNAVILEIGSGNGNLLSLIKRNIQGATCIDIDLPETISHAILFLKDQFPDAKILMPNEVNNIEQCSQQLGIKVNLSGCKLVGKNFEDVDF